MAEYINKEELIKACDYTVCYEDDEETFGISEARIDLMPTIDIVTCGKCKHFRKGEVCELYHVNKGKADFFCADGERRKE